SCSAPKGFPGVFDTNSRQYDLYTFSTCPESVATCASVTTSGSAVDGNLFFTAAFAPLYNPGSIATNWQSDPGASGRVTYQVNVGAGAQTVSIVVHELSPTPSAAFGQSYTLTVAGLCAGGCMSPNQLPVAIAKNVTISV